MTQVFKNPFFITGLPLAICGFTFGLIGIASNGTFGYMTPGFLIPGLIMMGYGWIKRKGRKD
ncbi:hypothetical protein [Pseudomonas sp. CJQ_13]|uniref:hypothetical protein n=1 Tax=Pseudomonas sp. CJQ_13 TaxID=3367170 RepID=UPI00370B9930